MPSEILIPTAQNLPDGFCPTTWQSTVNAFAAAMRVTLPTSASQIIVQENTPAPADQNKIWFQVNEFNHVLAIKSFDYQTNEWERVDEEQYYFNDIGTTNAIQIVSGVFGDNVTDLSDLVGRLLIIKVANTNNTAGVTIEMDNLTPTTVKKFGATDLEAGNITAGMACMFIYDGTNFQLLNPKYIPPSGSAVYYYKESPTFALPNNNTKIEWVHGFSPNKPTYVTGTAVCVTANNNYNVGDEVDVLNFFSYIIGGADSDVVPYFVSFNDTNVSLVAGPLEQPGNPSLWDKNTGARALAGQSNWLIKFKATRIVPI